MAAKELRRLVLSRLNHGAEALSCLISRIGSWRFSIQFGYSIIHDKVYKNR
jgi:hypothetical protein